MAYLNVTSLHILQVFNIIMLLDNIDRDIEYSV